MTDDELLPGERILASARRHWVVMLRPTATIIVAAVLAAVVVAILPLRSEVHLFGLLGVLIVALVLLNFFYLGWRSQQYILTDQRVILNEGLISRYSRSILIDRIQDLTTYQGLWARAWGFGDIQLESAGREGGEWLRTVPRPQQFRNAIFAQMEARRTR
ncbi:MAG: PH domain-containing protein [Candidatus Dormibacteraeota bacterium]|nr:PH domain-containing protein [Candidatus Dormibacteraeota bacterium]